MPRHSDSVNVRFFGRFFAISFARITWRYSNLPSWYFSL